MARFVLARLALVVPTFFGITAISFSLIHLVPGDPIEILAGERGIDAGRHALLRAEMGLDDPLAVQYARYIGDVLQGDLGRSVVTRTPVIEEFAQLFPATLELTAFAMLFAVAIGIPLGILAACKRGTLIDLATMGTALAGYSMPIFWWAMLLILLFSVELGWTPVSGRIGVLHEVPPATGLMLVDTLIAGDRAAFVSAARHLVLPAVALGTIPLAAIARMTRAAMLEILGQDYIRAARARGLSPARVIWVHALRNALIPVVTVIGLAVGVLLAGAILTETIFSWPGIGKWMVDAVRRRDFPVLQGGVLLIAAVVIAVNLTVDLAYGLIHPRIRRRT
jgi:dipeptide transport system permease protein